MGSSGAIMGLLIFFLSILIFVAISRWVFRINDIVKRLDQIIELLGKEGGLKT
jgi:hypothetical protein